MINIRQSIYGSISPFVSLLCLLLLISCQASAYSKPEITATYYLENNQGETIRCYTSGHESTSIRKEMQQQGCTLETLSSREDINVTVTLASEGTSQSILLASKYYLMWVGAGIHAINLGRNVPFVVTSLLSARPMDVLGYLTYSYFYYTGFTYYARDTVYPFLANNFPASFDSSQNDIPIQAWTLGDHAWVLIFDLIMWWNDVFYIGNFDVNRLMVGVDLLNFLIGRFL